MTAPDARALLDELEKLRGAIGDSPAFRVVGFEQDAEEVLARFDDGGTSVFAECYGTDAAELIVAAVNALPALTAALRAALAEALDAHRIRRSWLGGVDCRCGWFGHGADYEQHRVTELLPTVRAAMDQRAAEELEAAARTMPVQDHEMGYAIRNGLEPGPGKWLRDRAAALRGEAGR